MIALLRWQKQHGGTGWTFTFLFGRGDSSTKPFEGYLPSGTKTSYKIMHPMTKQAVGSMESGHSGAGLLCNLLHSMEL